MRRTGSSGPGHWQHWLFEELKSRGRPVLFPQLPDDTDPQVDRWVATIRELVVETPGFVTFVAHSLGVWAVDHYLARHGSAPVERALLVAPPSPFSLFEPIQSFLPPPRSREAWAPIRERSLLVGSDNDDHAGDGELAELSGAIAVPHRILPGAGHINAAAGFGPFPFVLDWLGEAGSEVARAPGG